MSDRLFQRPYCGPPPMPHELWTQWNFDPAVLLGLVFLGVALSRAAGCGSKGMLAAGWLALLVAFVSPLCALSSALFSARIVHHGLLVVAAAPLLAFGLPMRRAPLSLAPAGLLHAGLFWIWHAPGPYDWALSNDAAYWLMELSLAGSAFAFWAAVRAARPLGAGAALLAVMAQMGLLAALITFAGQPLYAAHAASPQAWGLSPLSDQQLGGVIMWAPMTVVYLGAALALAGGWLRREVAA